MLSAVWVSLHFWWLKIISEKVLLLFAEIFKLDSLHEI